MSTIGSNPHLNVNGLGGLGGQVALDDPRGRQQPGPAEALRETGLTGIAPVQVDAGELVLQADAWEGAAPETRLLSGDPGFEAAMGGMELSAAADHAVDAIFGELDAIA